MKEWYVIIYFINHIGKLIGEKARTKKLLIIFLIFLLIAMIFNFLNKNLKLKGITNIVRTPLYNFTPTSTIIPVQYPQLFYFKSPLDKSIKLPKLNTNYILSGNNDNKFKYWCVLVTSPASDDIIFISYITEIGENEIEFENIGNNIKNAKYKFIKGLLN